MVDPNTESLVDVPFQINRLAHIIHEFNQKWWFDLYTGEKLERNDGELIALMHSELSEGLEGVRKNKMDDHCPQHPNVTVEMADCIIRILDYCAGKGLNVGQALVDKCAYNLIRADHSHEHRKAEGGKKF